MYNKDIVKNQSVSIKEAWETKKPDMETDKTVKEIQSIGGSNKYGQGGRFTEDGFYIALNGHKSKGGSPMKLKCSDGEIPISVTDFQTLRNLSANDL